MSGVNFLCSDFQRDKNSVVPTQARLQTVPGFPHLSQRQTFAAPQDSLFSCEKDEIVILMGTCNSASYLTEQLNSLSAQTYQHWKLVVCDDHSDDDTYDMLCGFQAHDREKINVRRLSANVGFQKNFLGMLCDPQIEAPYFAFCDQDDIWHDDKLERAMDWLCSIDPAQPALYCSRTLTVDAANQEMGLSPYFKKPPSFANALIQSLAGGNTMVFNQAARQLALEAGADVDIACHDWWMYILVSGAGGTIYYDPIPSLRYRQHAHNFLGSNNSFSARLQRLNMVRKGQLKSWNEGHLSSLQRVEYRFTEENREILRVFRKVRRSSFSGRLLGVLKSGLYRQTLFGQMGLIAASMSNKI